MLCITLLCITLRRGPLYHSPLRVSIFAFMYMYFMLEVIIVDYLILGSVLTTKSFFCGMCLANGHIQHELLGVHSVRVDLFASIEHELVTVCRAS